VSHYYLGVIGMDPTMHGLGIGTRLLRSFCDLSASDPRSSGVHLETANPSNVRFYERAGFAVTGQGSLGSETLWCMFLSHGPRHAPNSSIERTSQRPLRALCAAAHVER